MFSLQHTKTTMLEDKKKTNAELQSLKTDNAQTDRVLKQARNFTGKRDKAHKDMKDAETELVNKIVEQNEKLNKISWEIDVWKRKLADKNLPKSLSMQAMDLR